MSETSSDPVLREYARLAHRYDTRWSKYVRSSVENTLGRVPLREGDRVLDVGCGTGHLIAALLERKPSTQVFGADASPEMLGVARSRLADGAPLVQARAEALPYRDATFDWVVSTNVFHFLRRPRVALGEFHRVLKPAGNLVITDWCDDYLACKICDRILRVFSRAHFRTYTRKECARLLREAGFEPAAIDRYRLNWLWGCMTARADKQDRVELL